MLCIILDLDVSKIDFFKTVVDDQLVDMKEASPEAEVLKDMTTNNPTPRFKKMSIIMFKFAYVCC